jgi:hypothetical protein
MNTTQTLILTCWLMGAALVVVISGCGGGDSTASGQALPKAQFIKRASSICENSEGEQLQMMFAYAKKHPGAEEEEMVKPAALPPLEQELEDIKSLGAPEGDEAEIDAWLKEFEATIKKVTTNPGSILNLQNNPFDQANKMIAKYGLDKCATAP